VSVVGLLIALPSIGFLYQWVATARRRSRFAAPGALIDVGGHRLHAICRGTGGPVVLLESGIASSSLSWTVVQPEIAKFTQVCAYDRAGLAWSDAACTARSFDHIVDEAGKTKTIECDNEHHNQCRLADKIGSPLSFVEWSAKPS
jgi:hypothetical protein